ncbi:MAG: 2Fe-2S iron-sulfur cluster-binding protein, partial [Chloroflexi bacterium]|nr:2Fe-2S iron-sulfur cluster-binding protein [Chloroflexota bacterium]
MVTLTINDREIQAEKGKTILEVARDNGIEIPALCYSDGVEPYGACRLCLVEITKGGRSRLVTSCLYSIEEGLVVGTATDRVMANRKMLMELLLARCTGVKVIEDMAKKMGVVKTSFKPEYLEHNECI